MERNALDATETLHVSKRCIKRSYYAPAASLTRQMFFFMCGVYVTYVWCVEVATYTGTDPGSGSYIQAIFTQMIRCR